MNRKFLLSGGGIALILLVAVVYIFASVLKTPLFVSTPEITVELKRTGGLFEGSLATYRGVRVGKVTAIDLSEGGVTATVRLSGDEHIPQDSRVQVRSLSPVGEQYLDFQPQSTKAPYLKSGDVIPASSTDLPQTLGGLSITLNKLIEQIDPKKVSLVLNEINDGLAGTDDDLRKLLDNGTRLLARLDQNFAVTQRVLRNGRTLLQIGADTAPDLERLASSASTFAAWLRRFDPTLFRLLKRAPGQLEELRGLVEDMAQTVPQLLDPAVTLTDIMAAHDPHIRQLMVKYPQGLQALIDAIHEGQVNLNAIVEQPQFCDYSTTERSPRDVSFRALQTHGRCSRSVSYSQRGAQWAPPPVR